MENINAYLANTTQADIAASDNQQPFINAKDLPLVTNQGIYRAQVIDAYLNNFNGRLKMSLNLFAELEGHPNHKGLLKLYIDVLYQPVGGAAEISRQFIGALSACKCFDEQGRPWANQVEKMGKNEQPFTVVENMLNKIFYVAVASREYNGKNYLNPVAFFDVNKRSPAEALNNKEPQYINKFSYLVPEGLPLKQQQARVNPANTGFAMPKAPSIAPSLQPIQFGQQQSAAPTAQGFNNVQANGEGNPWGASPMMQPAGNGFNAGQFGGYSPAAPMSQSEHNVQPRQQSPYMSNSGIASGVSAFGDEAPF